jgi:hypothetical protein
LPVVLIKPFTVARPTKPGAAERHERDTRVRQNGEIRWRNNTIYVNQALVGEPIALEENAAGL